MTKSELRSLIREEIRKTLKEQQSNIELIGPNIDELLNAITFYTKSNNISGLE